MPEYDNIFSPESNRWIGIGYSQDVIMGIVDAIEERFKTSLWIDQNDLETIILNHTHDNVPTLLVIKSLIETQVLMSIYYIGNNTTTILYFPGHGSITVRTHRAILGA